MKRAAQTLLIFLCLAFTAAAAFNVFSDNTEVEQLARTVACRDESSGCAPTLTQLSRTPFGQSMQFSTLKKNVGIRCSRTLMLVGPYECSRE
ncbi:hypothetical protein [Chondromyces apiculatus]|uniref:Secreted protein n=1 Tax=Chondromyces apiculatus DSM 436 TaxID=1192034 RepID=A0A017T390_9BACT|nr:hypothetical protein [Chondromyces apiculatus]EYF03698.1 Hypothetical protein CAP_5309 [Chondromyces apiculatus DSM 436]